MRFKALLGSLTGVEWGTERNTGYLATKAPFGVIRDGTLDAFAVVEELNQWVDTYCVPHWEREAFFPTFGVCTHNVVGATETTHRTICFIPERTISHEDVEKIEEILLEIVNNNAPAKDAIQGIFMNYKIEEVNPGIRGI